MTPLARAVLPHGHAAVVVIGPKSIGALGFEAVVSLVPVASSARAVLPHRKAVAVWEQRVGAGCFVAVVALVSMAKVAATTVPPAASMWTTVLVAAVSRIAVACLAALRAVPLAARNLVLALPLVAPSRVLGRAELALHGRIVPHSADCYERRVGTIGLGEVSVAVIIES